MLTAFRTTVGFHCSGEVSALMERTETAITGRTGTEVTERTVFTGGTEKRRESSAERFDGWGRCAAPLRSRIGSCARTISSGASFVRAIRFDRARRNATPVEPFFSVLPPLLRFSCDPVASVSSVGSSSERAARTLTAEPHSIETCLRGHVEGAAVGVSPCEVVRVLGPDDGAEVNAGW